MRDRDTSITSLALSTEVLCDIVFTLSRRCLDLLVVDTSARLEWGICIREISQRKLVRPAILMLPRWLRLCALSNKSGRHRSISRVPVGLGLADHERGAQRLWIIGWTGVRHHAELGRPRRRWQMILCMYPTTS